MRSRVAAVLLLFIALASHCLAQTGSVSLAVSPASAKLGSLFTLTASVQGQNGKPATNGSVTFYAGSSALGTAQVVSTASAGGTVGAATLKVILTTVGTNNLKAAYVLGNVAVTSAPATATVTGKYPSATQIASTGSAGNYTLTETVTGSEPPAPTGAVTFTDATTGLIPGTATLGPATFAQTFVSAPTISGFSGPVVDVLADLNGDGIPDLLMGDGIQITLAFGNGDGSFQASNLILSGPASEKGIVVGDFNGDGIPDLAVVSGGTLFVLLGKGDGTFQAPISCDSGVIGQLTVGDFNGDGILDLVTLNSSGAIDLLLGNGDGSFKPPVQTKVSSPLSLAAGDVNGDGLLDVVVATAPNNVSVFLGNADGTLHAGQTYVTQYEPGNMVLADFRSIGKLDLGTVFNQCCEGNNTNVYLMLGNGDGTFQNGQTILSGTNYSGLSAADFNGDGKLDLAVSDYGYPQANVLLGNGDGTFQIATTYPAGVGPITPAIADLNHDGWPDFIVPNFNDGNGDVFLSQVTQTALATLTGALLPGTGTHSVTGAYSGDTNYASATSNTLQLAASLVTPAMTLAALPGATVAFGQALSVSVTLTGPLSFVPAPSGSVSYAIDGGTAQSAALTGGAVTIPLTQLSIGSHSVAVSYGGDEYYGSLAPQTLPLTVTGNPIAIFGTGYVAGGPGLTPPGSVDGNYKLISCPAGPCANQPYVTLTGGYPFPPWLANTSAAQWIGPDSGGNENVIDSPGLYDYEESFDLTGFDLSTVVLTGSFATDNSGYFQLNGATVGPASSSSSSLTPFTLTSGFRQGINTIDFFVTNGPTGGLQNPTGLFVELSGTGQQNSSICTSAPGMNITYLTVGETDQDAARAPSGISSNYVLPGLGKDGLPVYNPNATATTGGVYAPYDLLSDGEITWWNPVLNNGAPGGTSDVVETGTGTVTLPFADNAFFPPNGTGPNDLNGFQAAILSGTLVAPAAETVSFSISSDDMAFVYLDGQIACDDGGVHGAAATPCNTPVIAAGEHTLELFYIDLHTVGAVLDFSLTTLNVCTNPIQHTTTLTWPTPAPITYGTPLSATQLDASSGGVAGTFAYNPAAGSVLPAGTHTLAVAFTPTDTADYTSATATVQLTVNRAPVTVALTANPGSIPAGNSITLTATVQSTTTGTPTGTVTFFNGTSTLGTANLVNGVATLTASLSTQGTDSITASYPGDTDFLPGASNAVSVNVLSASTSTLLTGSPNPAPFGTTVIFSATVSSPGGTPAGSVSFFDGVTLLGTSTLASGVATYSTSTLAVGSHNITATYPGSAQFNASASNVFVEQIADFAVSVLPGSRTLYTGEAASFAVSVTSVSGFNIPVALTCSQLPENTTCSFSAATVTGAGGSSTLTVQTTAPSQIVAGSALSGGYRVVALAAIFLIFIPRRWRRHRQSWSLILVIFAILASWAAITGCSASRSLVPGTPVGIDTVTVTGTATNGSQTLAHATSVTLNVKSLF